MSLFRVKEGRLLEDWMTARARAETKRLSYFSYVVNSSVQPLDLHLELLKLEYFRRYQLDLQLAYYKTRRSGHRNSAERTLSISAGSVLVAAIASGAAGVLGALRSEWAALGSLAVFGAALQAFAASRESINQDRRNAERYENTAQALQGLRERLDDVRLGIAAGSTSVLGEYVAAVQDQLSLEHRQWLEGAENMQAAVARLEKALSSGASQKDTASSEEGCRPQGLTGGEARAACQSGIRSMQLIACPAIRRKHLAYRSALCRHRPTSPFPMPVPHSRSRQ